MYLLFKNINLLSYIYCLSCSLLLLISFQNNAVIITSVDIVPFNRKWAPRDPCTPWTLLGKEVFMRNVVSLPEYFYFICLCMCVFAFF